MKALVDQALKNSGDINRYKRRMDCNPTLAVFGCLPEVLADISNREPPWFCHGLAFRMATYSDASDKLFNRWDRLLNLERKAKGWQREYGHWNAVADHWAKKWDRFHHFIWLLQCYEYLSQSSCIVSFPAPVTKKAMPDLLIVRPEQKERLFAECYFYSKYWPREQYLEELLRFIDPDLSIKRTYNLKRPNNPFSDHEFISTLGQISTALTQRKLSKLRAAATLTSPQKVCEIGDIAILLNGTGEYQPSQNAHGDAAEQWPVFLNQIIKAKKDSNNLNDSRPNIVLVNALGLDFQFSHSESLDRVSARSELPLSIDEIWISVCGIDEKLETCQRVQKILREGYAGSGI